MTHTAADGILFVVWEFPLPSETFIHRELVEIARRGGAVRVLAARRVPRPDVTGPLAEIADRALYLGSPARIARRGLAWAARNPGRFAAVLSEVARMRHRNVSKRARALRMVVAAAAAVEEVRPLGVRHVQGHFAARAAELAMALGRMLDVPYGITAHARDIYVDANALPDKIAGARAVLTCTAFNLEHLRGLSPEHAHKLHLVHHGIDLSSVPEPATLPSGPEARFLAVGRLVPKKGFVHLVEAARRLVERGVAARVAILGDGPERGALADLVRARGIEDVVELAGAVPNSRVWAELERSLALVTPSVRDDSGDMDGIPNVILEAMASARPVIGTRLSGIPEVVIDGQTGLLVAPGDTGALAEAMARIAADRPAAARMGQAGRALVVDGFDVRANVDRQLRLLA